jgi:peptidoglycan/xylan/chitin deacetylase (PgdA/CDA1 family)
MQLAFKIDVDTFRGTREGVPRLVELLKRHQVQATFFFTLGHDRSGRGIFNLPRVSRIKHYGFNTLLYGTLLPAPDIGGHCAEILRQVRDEGFEVALHGNENVLWRKCAATESAEWTKHQMELAVARFAEIFGEPPKAFAAAGWQVNRNSLRFTQRMGFDYASDTRGSHPFIPTWDAEIIACPQLPTTLPTLDELLLRNGLTVQNVAEHLLAFTQNGSNTGHVFTLRAEFEGGKWLSVFEQLLIGWKAQGYELVSLRQYLQASKDALPRHPVKMEILEGRSGALAVQG